MKFPGARPLARIVLALVAVAAVVITVAGCSLIGDAGKSDTAKAQVGDCINVIEGSAVDSKTEPVDCSSDKAVYKVAQSYDKKTDCAPDYTSYEETLGGGTTAFLCLAPNFKEGSCYNESSTTGYKHVDCGAAEATFKVLKRIDGQADELLCGEDATGFRLIETDPKVTFCTGNPKG
ncbi:LppU/SCO3897 family protein [Nocardia asteroides]